MSLLPLARSVLGVFQQQPAVAKTPTAPVRAPVDSFATVPARATASGTSPYDTLTAIKNLPLPNPNDPAGVAAYNKRRAQLADAGIAKATPPKREDFDFGGEYGRRTAQLEYRDALSAYNDDLAKLKDI